MAQGTGVLVPGGWSNPSDWDWVAELLRNDDIAVLAADPPSHHGLGAGRDADVRSVEELIDRATSPVVVASWSYGGAVISDLEHSVGPRPLSRCACSRSNHFLPFIEPEIVVATIQKALGKSATM